MTICMSQVHSHATLTATQHLRSTPAADWAVYHKTWLRACITCTYKGYMPPTLADPSKTSQLMALGQAHAGSDA
jgi:hypothetical protein